MVILDHEFVVNLSINTYVWVYACCCMYHIIGETILSRQTSIDHTVYILHIVNTGISQHLTHCVLRNASVILN